MKVYIITEGSAEVGLGHISRCTSLYQAFEEKKIYPCFIINGNKLISQYLKKKNYILLDWIKNESHLIQKINGSDIAIVDSYIADISVCDKIANNVKIVGFIDDDMRLNYPSGVVINGSIHAKNLKYPKNQNIDYLLGPQYIMLKKEFWDIPKKEINKRLKKILITLGGSDNRNLTPKILRMLNSKFPELIKKIIIGKGFKNISEIKKTCNEYSELIYSPSSKRMKKEILNSDIAITAGGQTVYELACVGIPAISIAVAENQINSVKNCDELGLNYYAGWWKDNNLLNNIRKSISNLKNQELRKVMRERGQNLIKPDGSRKIINYLIKKSFEK